MNTKERILQESLRLFSTDGYEAVSMRQIAAKLDMAQSAIYKHYRSKRDIFDSIVERMRSLDEQRAKEHSMPEQSFSELAEPYRIAAAELIKSYALAQFIFWTQDEFASDFRRMLTIEQYRSGEMTQLYQQYLSGGIIGYMEDIFRESRAIKSARHGEPRLLALEFFSPLYMLMSLCDSSEDKAKAAELAKMHIDGFFDDYMN